MAQVKGSAKEKEPAASVTSIYLQVVEDVIQNVRDDFQSEDVDESVLVELRQLWELKMMQAGAIEGGAVEAGRTVPAKTAITATPVHDLNVPYEATDEYQTPTVDLLFPPTPQAMTPIVMTPLPMTPQVDALPSQLDVTSPVLTSTGEPIMYQHIPPGSSESAVGGGDENLELDGKLGRPASYMQPPAPWMNQKPRGVDVNIDMNATYEEGQEEDEPGNRSAPITKDFFALATGKRKREDPIADPHGSGYISQQDGAGDVHPTSPDFAESGGRVLERKVGRYSNPTSRGHERCDLDIRLSVLGEAVSRSGRPYIPQYCGVNDDYSVAEEDYNEPGEEEPQPAVDTDSGVLKVEPTGGDSESEEPPLNEDDDDELDDDDLGDEKLETQHLVLAQFDKVKRSKKRWRCTLKDGIMHLNDKDILFVQAAGEFDF